MHTLAARMNALQSRIHEATMAAKAAGAASPRPLDSYMSHQDAQSTIAPRKLDLDGTPTPTSDYPEERRLGNAYADAFASIEADRQRHLIATSALAAARRTVDPRMPLRRGY